MGNHEEAMEIIEEVFKHSADFEEKILEISKDYLEEKISAEDAMHEVTKATAFAGLHRLVLFAKLKGATNGND